MVQENEHLKTRNLEKCGKKLRLKNRMLANTDDLCFVYLEPCEGHYQFFCLKSRFLNFCESFIPNFKKLHYLLHLNESEDDVVRKKTLIMIVQLK